MASNLNRKTLLPAIRWTALLAASVRAFVLFIILDIVLEYVLASLFAIQVKTLLPRQELGTPFVIAYYGIIYVALFIMLLAAVATRPLFHARRTAAISVGLVFYLFTGLMMLQLYNLGVLSGQLFLMMGASNGIELPLVLWMGVGTYAEASSENETKAGW